jgi:anti-anti-sigma regulatory factor
MEAHVELEIEVDAIAGVLVVVVTGDVVEGSLGPLRECLEQAVSGGRPVVVDLLAADEFDDAGLGLLVGAHDAMGTRLRVVAERGGIVHRRLKEAGIAHVLALHRNRVNALLASTPRETAPDAR